MSNKKKQNKKNSSIQIITSLIFAIILGISIYISDGGQDIQNVIKNINNKHEKTLQTQSATEENNKLENEQKSKINTNINIDEIPEYSGRIYIEINNNIPYFTDEEYTTEPFETYSELDMLGRCGIAYANICKEIMPQDGERRERISNIKPTGWVQKRYNGEFLYNRCHLIAHQLAAENANKLNLITGTRYFNVDGMLPFENKVANYIYNNEKNHVLYRVTPIYLDENLLASGVEIEAYSVEDKGNGVCFNVYIYNVQPGIEIDYKSGASEVIE